jgi:hypothetical protein
LGADALLGTASWGTSLSGGGWVLRDDPEFEVVDLCLFSDLSAIDQWGIAYHTGDVVRGKALAEVFRFDPQRGAAVLPGISSPLSRRHQTPSGRWVRKDPLEPAG